MSEIKRVVFDLDGTLIQSDPEGRTITLRPGAEDLLRQLKNNGLDLILWTTAGQGWADRVFAQFPDLQENFSQIITAANMGKYLKPLRAKAARLDKDDPRTWCLKTLSEGGGGGKYPPAVNARYLIDDVTAAAYTAKVMGTFEHIFPNSKESDSSPDDWAKRVAQALLGE